MAPRRLHTVSPDQGSMYLITGEEMIPDPVATGEVAAPVIAPIDRQSHDPYPGLFSPVIEGLTVMDKVVKDIGRSHSNQGFGKLAEGSRPVKRFSDQIGQDPDETIELVRSASPRAYRRAQLRLNFYNEKQVRQARNYNRYNHIAPDEVIDNMLPMDAGAVEYRFFHANTPAEAAVKAAKRRALSRYVVKHGL